MTIAGVARPTAVDDVYRCAWLDDQIAIALPTGHQSLRPAWQWVLEPNACMPISQALLAGGFVMASFGQLDATLPDKPASSRRGDIIAAQSAYESRRRVALNDSVADTLNDLTLTFGASWVDVARMLGVSVAALRKWRLGESKPRKRHRERLAALVGCFAALRECGVDEPAGLLEVRLLDSYSITLGELFAPERVNLFLRYSIGDLSAVELLDALSPDWRQLYRAQTQIYRDADGELAMRIQPEY